MLIYEVNLTIQPDVFDAYCAWLKPHITEIVALPGFLNARLFEHNEEDALKHLVVQYEVASKPDLQDYFDHHAAAMRDDGIKRFEGQFSATRRVLEAVWHTAFIE